MSAPCSGKVLVLELLGHNCSFNVQASSTKRSEEVKWSNYGQAIKMIKLLKSSRLRHEEMTLFLL